MVVLIVGTVLALLLRSRLSVERPGGFQQVAEMLLTNPLGFGIKDLLEENVGHYAIKFIAFTGSISIFILLGESLGRYSGVQFAHRWRFLSCRLGVRCLHSSISTGRDCGITDHLAT